MESQPAVFLNERLSLHPQHQRQIELEAIKLESTCIALGPLRPRHASLVLGHRVAIQVSAIRDGIDGCAARKQGVGGRGPRRVDLQRAEVELGGSHLREPRTASIRRQVCAGGADATDNASAICVRVVPYDRVLDVDHFLAAANVDGGRVRGIRPLLPMERATTRGRPLGDRPAPPPGPGNPF